MGLLGYPVVAEGHQHKFGVVLLYIVTDDVAVGNYYHAGVYTLLDDVTGVETIRYEAVHKCRCKTSFK